MTTARMDADPLGITGLRFVEKPITEEAFVKRRFILMRWGGQQATGAELAEGSGLIPSMQHDLGEDQPPHSAIL